MDWIRLLWAGMLLNGGGVVGLALTLDSRVKLSFLIAGAFLEGVLGVLILISHRKVSALITKLEEA
jgi:hypothetical protein